jgi:hypothetical protein
MTEESRLRAVARSIAARVRGVEPGGWWTAIVLSIATAAIAWPLVTCEWMPFVDYPQHVATVAAIHGQGGDAYWSEWFVVEYARTQYLLVYVLGDWLAYLFGVEGACRVVSVLTVAGLPLCVAASLRANGRPALAAAAAAPISVSTFVIWGFLNYAIAIDLALLSLAALAWLVRKPSWPRAALFGVLAIATFYGHAQLYAWLGLGCIVQLLAMGPLVSWRQTWAATWRAAIASVPSIAATGWWLYASGVVERGDATERGGLAEQVQDQGASWMPVADTLKQWLDHSFAMYRDGGGERIALVFFALVLSFAIFRGVEWASRARTPKPWSPDTAASRTIAPELLVLFAFASYLFAPYSFKVISPINHRFLPLAFALLPALGPLVPVRASLRGLLGIASVAGAIYVGDVHADHFAVIDDEMGELEDALAHTQPGRKLIGFMYDRDSSVVPLPMYLHAHQYYQSRVGGLAAFSFFEFPKSPVQYRQGAGPPPFPARFEWTPERFQWATWGEYFDYFLVRVPPGRPPRSFFPIGAPNAPELVFDGSRWKLYAKPGLGAEAPR